MKMNEDESVEKKTGHSESWLKKKRDTVNLGMKMSMLGVISQWHNEFWYEDVNVGALSVNDALMV